LNQGSSINFKLEKNCWRLRTRTIWSTGFSFWSVFDSTWTSKYFIFDPKDSTQSHESTYQWSDLFHTPFISQPMFYDLSRFWHVWLAWHSAYF